jgi:hypothetical protein
VFICEKLAVGSHARHVQYRGQKGERIKDVILISAAMGHNVLLIFATIVQQPYAMNQTGPYICILPYVDLYKCEAIYSFTFVVRPDYP